MTDRFEEILLEIAAFCRLKSATPNGHIAKNLEILTDLATESEQLRKGLAELETLLAQANKKIQWYERTEATNE